MRAVAVVVLLLALAPVARAAEPVAVETLAQLNALPPATEAVQLGGVLGNEALAALPRITGLKTLVLTDGLVHDDAGLAHLGLCPNLSELVVHGSARASAKGLGEIAKLEKLEALTLAECPLATDKGLEALAAAARSLKRVRLAVSPVKDAGLASVARLPALEELTLEACKSITTKGVVTLARSTTLRRLWIVGPCAVDAGLVDALAPIQALDELALIGLEATDAWLKPLARLDKLRTLTLMLPGIGDKGLEHVARAKGLTSLTLRELGTFVTGAGLRQLGTIEGLRRLSFGGARWGPRDLERAIGPDRLEELELRELRATRDEVVAVILRQTKLKALALDEVELSDAAFLRLAELEKLERLDLVHCLVSAAAVERFKKLRPECKVTFVPA